MKLLKNYWENNSIIFLITSIIPYTPNPKKITDTIAYGRIDLVAF